MPFSNLRPSIFLDYGADAVTAEDAACEICERGMRFCSQWQFALGSVLHISFSFDEGGPCRIEVEGLVVDCVAEAENEYRTTLSFVDPPCELRTSLGKVSTRLEFRRANSG